MVRLPWTSVASARAEKVMEKAKLEKAAKARRAKTARGSRIRRSPHATTAASLDIMSRIAGAPEEEQPTKVSNPRSLTARAAMERAAKAAKVRKERLQERCQQL